MATEKKVPISEPGGVWNDADDYLAIDECTDTTTTCLDTHAGYVFYPTGGVAIREARSYGSDDHDLEFGDTTYDNVSKFEVFCYSKGENDVVIVVDSDLVNDPKTIVADNAGVGWYSISWEGSFSKAQINGMVVTFTAQFAGSANAYIAASFIEYTEAAVGGNAPTGTIYGPLVGPMGGPI